MKQFVEWFSLEAVSASASRFNQEKFLWLNAQHIKAADNSRLAALIAPRLAAAGVDTATGPAIEDVIALVKERIQDLNALAVEVDYFYKKREAAAADVEKHLAGDAVARMGRFCRQAGGTG